MAFDLYALAIATAPTLTSFCLNFPIYTIEPTCGELSVERSLVRRGRPHCTSYLTTWRYSLDHSLLRKQYISSTYHFICSSTLLVVHLTSPVLVAG